MVANTRGFASPSPQGDYTKTISAICDVVADVSKIAGCDRQTNVGVGIPGATSPKTGLVKNANSTWLIGHSLERDLCDALARDVRIDNDANCFAISEAVDGAGKDCNVVFGVILGTGVGGGIAINGSPLTGRNAITGEWGHNPIALAKYRIRTSRAIVLLRQNRLHRDISVRSRIATRSRQYGAARTYPRPRLFLAQKRATPKAGGNHAALCR